MNIEIILFGVVAIVLVLDFALRGVKKKNIQDDVERIGEEQSKKKALNFNYILARKRNILTFILLVMFFKPLINFQFFTEEEGFINTEKKFPAPDKRKDFIALANINHEVVKIYKTHFYTRAWNSYSEVYFHTLIKLNPRYKLKINGFDLETFTEVVYPDYYSTSIGEKVFKLQGDTLSTIRNHWIVKDGLTLNNPQSEIIYSNEHFIGQLAQEYYYGCSWTQCEIIIPKNERKIFLKEYERPLWIYTKFSNENFNTPFQIQRVRAASDWNEPLKVNNEVQYLTPHLASASFLPKTEAETEFITRGWVKARGYEFILVPENYAEFSEVDGIKKMLESGMYMDYDTKLLYDSDGNQVIVEKDGRSTNFYIHPLETRKTDIKNHFNKTFKTKLWLFVVSFALLGVLVFLFNDKIKAR